MREIFAVLGLIVLTQVGCHSGKQLRDELSDEFTSLYQSRLQQFLEAEPFQDFFYKRADGSPYPVFIVHDAIIPISAKVTVEKFGKPVRFITEKEAVASNLESFLSITDYVDDGRGARLMFDDPIRNIRYGVSFSIRKGKEELLSTYIETDTLLLCTYDGIPGDC